MALLAYGDAQQHVLHGGALLPQCRYPEENCRYCSVAVLWRMWGRQIFVTRVHA